MDTVVKPASSEATPRGIRLLHDPLLNKGTAFTEAERDALGLRGLLPANVMTLERQVERVLENMRRLANPLDKFIALNALHDRNETLFFRVVADNPDEIMPLIYTPTVGLACQRYGHIYQQARGMFISAKDRGHVAEVLRNWPRRDVGIIVVSDGERILGLGDLGANGMGIPVGKLSLYTACAGVAPERCLPVMFDAGTNNEDLLDDPFYIGTNRTRLPQDEYDALFDEFVTAAREIFPGVLIQFEDFASHNAFRLLDRYRERICCFNDDIQGTAAVVLAGLLSALRVTGGALSEKKVLFMGAGEAATGIADLIALAASAQGITLEQARANCWLFDSKGLVVKERKDLASHKLPYAHEHARISSFAQAVKAIRPAAIVGVAAVGGTFTVDVLREMASINQRPIVFALSNPTANSECTAAHAYEYTGGRALFACGSPFDPVILNGRTYVPRQGNNSYIFPGVGLGILAAKATRVTDGMFLAAAETLASLVTKSDLDQGSLYPPLAGIREVSAQIGAAVAGVAYRQGLAAGPQPADLVAAVRDTMYQPRYSEYVAAKG